MDIHRSGETGVRYGQLIERPDEHAPPTVGPGGDILARTWSKAGIAVAELDLRAAIAAARRVLRHVDELKPDAYRISR